MKRNPIASRFRRCGRLLLALVVGSALVVAPVSPAWAKKPTAVNAKLAEKEAGPDHVGAYDYRAHLPVSRPGHDLPAQSPQRGKATRLRAVGCDPAVPRISKPRAVVPLSLVRLPGSRCGWGSLPLAGSRNSAIRRTTVSCSAAVNSGKIGRAIVSKAARSEIGRLPTA